MGFSHALEGDCQHHELNSSGGGITDFSSDVANQPAYRDVPPAVVCTSTTGVLKNYIFGNAPQINSTQGTYQVPLQWEEAAFLGGSAFNKGAPTFANGLWNTESGTITNQINAEARRYFSLNTCNGCHGAETAVEFQQVVNRLVNKQAHLSNFLLGCQDAFQDNACGELTPGQPHCSAVTGTQCTLDNPGAQTVADPTGLDNTAAIYGDILNRISILQTLAGSDPGAAGMLWPFVRPHIGVH